ncbi:MAG: hypothetical protein HYW89_01475 [Candidatus Sungiibacteriota bacterium]|uniref:Type 4 fimbrial biogenesis protein PilX N-terminal domain-containing protein n=1 Tax=Candidatus Sungiibacteriota bacterium TaxID=2750080 RepID=A0A7T5RK01_9BACT|nr:MAG: hypothetical protein HYW89_01475 [Candidatus Sungbacteria bacterium]
MFILRSQRGWAALTVTMITVIVSLTIIGGFAFFSFQEVNTSRVFNRSLGAKYIAEGGLEDVIYRLVSGKQVGGSETLIVGNGTSTTTVTTLGSQRTIRSEGKLGRSQKNLEALIEIASSADVPLLYGAQVGAGGLEMMSNSTVKGSVYSNGHIIGTTNSTITGNAVAAGTSKIDKGVVNGNAQANLITASVVDGYASSTTLIDASVIGLGAHANELKASLINGDGYYQIIDPDTLILGQQFPNTPPPSNPAPVPLSVSDATVTQWKQEAQVIGTVASGSCSQDWSPPTNPYTLNGGVIETNLLLDNNQVLVLKGIVWVKCNVTIDNGSTVRLDSSFGDKSGVLMSDGWMHIKNNGLFQGSGTAGSFLMLLTTASGGGHHDSVIDLHNNATGAIFYASSGMIYLHNNVTATSLVGYKVHLENGATVEYNGNLVNTKFSSGSVGGADLKYWKEVE